MRYKGRIIATLVVLLVSVFDIIYHYLTGEPVPTLEWYNFLVYGPIAWFFGRNYDKAKYLSRNLKDIFNNVDALIWENDPINQRFMVSKGIERISGYPVKEFESNYFHWLDITYPDDKEKANEFYMQLLEGIPGTLEFRIIAKNKEVIWILAKGTPIFDKKRKSN